jgi:hypothetical protein
LPDLEDARIEGRLIRMVPNNSNEMTCGVGLVVWDWVIGVSGLTAVVEIQI